MRITKTVAILLGLILFAGTAFGKWTDTDGTHRIR